MGTVTTAWGQLTGGGGASTSIAPGTPIGDVTPGTGAFTTMSTDSGSATAPGWTWTSETGTGAYLAGAGVMAISLLGVAKWVFSNDAIRPAAANTLATIGLAAQPINKIFMSYTNTATVGAVTISKSSGRVNIAAAGTSVVVTNTLVTAASHVVAWVSSNDATAQVRNVVCAAGSFTINTAAVTAQTSFDFMVIGAD